MARYIDADRLRDRVKTETNPYGKPTLEYASGLKVLVMIDKEPTADVVEVVRCRDCKHYIDGRCYVGSRSLLFKYDVNIHHRKRDDFCSYGERKE